MLKRAFGFALAAIALAACGDQPTAPSERAAAPAGGEAVAQRAVKFWDAGSSVAWNSTARQLLAGTGPHVQSRILTYLSVAQYNAIVVAEDAKDRGNHASPAAAAGAASAAVLSGFFPLSAGLLEGTLDAQLAGEPWPGERTKDQASGEAVGRAVGAAVLAYAATDNFNLASLPEAPVGPAYWTSSLNPPAPSVRSLFGTRPFVLTSPDQFRPSPPPPFGSAAFLADLAEVRAISDTRTPAQLATAQLWAARGPAYLNAVASEMIVTHRKGEREAAHILAIANIAGFDATIACWDAKFAFWLVRPSQADPAITLPTGLPNHPSYTSGHSCTTASYAAVLASKFPTETARLETMVVEAGLSRIYGGIHYRFDIDAGKEIGEDVAALVLGVDVVGHDPIPLD